ncbi:LppP/LprE family lipoprotein [Williamsia sp. CHRR-6]|uniref:LppP/LprE family lipoprotein n=1 Tax=Williamsia sp. CHRR-6 TaxID=2835871 RepID=UPI001BDA6B1C|nr:LppP/LprE family lipoprotein [Williamsia sp. CHRR-6]MBT0566713.1 LppP/LprE family lipoprotein [Williamsia sp. CHRR-6]
MRTRPAFLATLALVVAPLGTAACGDESTATTATSTSTVTRTITPDAQAPDAQASDAQASAGRPATGGTDAGAPEGTFTTTPCGPRPLSTAVINAAIARIPTDGPAYRWTAEGSNFNSCNAISYVELATDRGTGSSPWQLMIFDSAGEFLGTGVRCNLPGQQVTGAGPDHIDVRYRYSKPGESTAGGTGVASVSFRWNGSRVVMVGTLPTELTFDRC